MWSSTLSPAATCPSAWRRSAPAAGTCEIGKVDIYADSALGLRVFRKNLRFAAIDLDRLMVDDPLLSRELSQACLDLLDRGVVPPLPVTVFPYGDYAKALRLMTTGPAPGQAGAAGAAAVRRARLPHRRPAAAAWTRMRPTS